MKTLVIIGAGGHGKVVAEAAAAAEQWSRVIFLDDRYPELRESAGFAIVGVVADLSTCYDQGATDVLVAIGANEHRLNLVQDLQEQGWNIPMLVHPSAWISPSAILGAGTVVFAQAAINAEARIGLGGIVNTGATIDHDCVLGDGVHVSPGAHLGGGVMVGDLSWIGIGAALKHQVRIGRRVMVGAGAAVVKDVADGRTVTGVPAG